MAKTLRDSLTRSILDSIFQGKLSAGDRLPTLEAMAREHHMSVASVREAIHKLSLMGMVRIQQGGGTFLAENVPSIIDILEARKHVEAATCMLAAKNGTKEDFEGLARIIQGMHEDYSRGDTVAYTQRDLEFHLAIGRMSKNVILSAFLENIQDLLYYLQQRTHMLRGTIEKAHRYHPRIAAALRARDGISAKALIVEHLESVMKAWSALDQEEARRGRASVKGGRKRIGVIGNGGR